MRNLIVATLAAVNATTIGYLTYRAYGPKERSSEIAEVKIVEIEEQTEELIKTEVIPYTDLIRAIIYVESKGDDLAVNKSSATGCMQIKPIMVREVNRILHKIGETRQFTLFDRYSRSKSIQMFNIWKQYHHPSDSDEVVARCWNGGGNGYKMKSTERYWNKVQRILKSFSETR
jgi:hypothetical protein